MSWFRRTKRKEENVLPVAIARVDVELDKAASAEAHELAKESSQHLNDLLIANGFTLKLYIAAGGVQPGQKNRGS